MIDSASSAEALRKRLKPEQLERYGEQFIPKFVYDAIRKLKRFDTMQVSLNCPLFRQTISHVAGVNPNMT